MALIKCPECKKEISDKSAVCINCGYPLDIEINNESSIDFNNNNKITKSSNKKTDNKLNAKCPKCGKPSSLTPKGRARLCEKCAEEKKLNHKKEIDTSNSNTSINEAVSKEINSDSFQKFKGFDNTKSNTIKKFFFQFLLSVICAGIAFVAGGLIVYIIQELLAGMVINLLVITMIGMSISSIIVGTSIGLAGPITLSQGAYVQKEKQAYIVKARSKPLKVLSLTIFSILTIISIVLTVIAFIVFKGKINPYTDNENTLMPIIIPFMLSVYYLTLTITTLININQSTCYHCGHIDCKIVVGQSDVKTEEKTQEKEVTYSGSSYDVIDGSGNTIGYIKGSDSKVTKHRTITTSSWNVYTKCKICGNKSNVKESSQTKSNWQ